MRRALKWLIAHLGFRRGPELPGGKHDPYAWRPVPRKPKPKPRSGAVAVMEPED